MAKKNDTITPAAQAVEAVSPTSDVRIVFVEREGSPERLVSEAELVFGSGPLAGMKLVGFSLWKSPEGDLYVTFPSRAFGAGSERRFFDFLRSAEGDAAPAKLADLAHAFRSNTDVRLEHVENWWVLQGSRFDPLPNAQAVHAEATEVVRTLSGIARLCLGSAARLDDGVIWKVARDGSRSPYILPPVAEAVALVNSITLSWTRVDGTLDERRPSDPGPAWLRAASAKPALVQALRQRDGSALSWASLYRIAEIAQDEAGGKKIPGWPSRTQMRRLKHTADSRTAAGDEARHAVERTHPPAKPMSLPEARLLIDKMLVLWLQNP